MHSSALVPVPVPGTDRPIMATEVDGTPMVAVAPVCEAIGVDPKSQRRKLQPEQHFQEVHGRPRKVNAYTEADRPIFDHVWNTYYEMAVLS